MSNSLENLGEGLSYELGILQDAEIIWTKINRGK